MASCVTLRGNPPSRAGDRGVTGAGDRLVREDVLPPPQVPHPWAVFPPQPQTALGESAWEAGSGKHSKSHVHVLPS